MTMFWNTTPVGRTLVESIRNDCLWKADRYRIAHPSGVTFWIANGRSSLHQDSDGSRASCIPQAQLSWADKRAIWAAIAPIVNRGVANALARSPNREPR